MSQFTELLAKSSAQFRILDLSALTNTVRCWDGGTIPNLIEATREDHDWTRLPILADALEEAGSTDTSLLAHLRYPVAASETVWLVTEPPPTTTEGWMSAFAKANPVILPQPAIRNPLPMLLLNRMDFPLHPGNARLVRIAPTDLGCTGLISLERVCILAELVGLKAPPLHLAPLFATLLCDELEGWLLWSVGPNSPMINGPGGTPCRHTFEIGYHSQDSLWRGRRIQLSLWNDMPTSENRNCIFLQPIS